ncbi:MAG: hypothetical protein AMJ46_10740 [Latescibacteria bacterium DG_63]|nr:MAG: hypothetical protein AMJ46_10740 [Latescibacteria bacterium DG_63]
MKKRSTLTRTSASTMIALFSLLIASLVAGAALAQDENDPAQVRNREETRITAQEPQGEGLRERIRERIESEVGLQDQERERLRQHLGECERHGFDDALVAALFSESNPLREQIRTQERVLALAREGLPVEPVAQKLQEGRQKGVSQETLEQVCARIAEHVRAAHSFMERAREGGIAPGDENAERRHIREMAMHMWHGLKEGDMDRIQTRARQRLQDGSCTTEDVVAAAETATRLAEMGIERSRAVRLAGDALQYGYTPREMRQLVWAVMTANVHGGPQDDVIDTLERGIRNQRQLSQMVQEMWQHGWMGPADEHGGRSPMDNAPGSGPGSGQQGQGAGEDGQGGGGSDKGSGGK